MIGGGAATTRSGDSTRPSRCATTASPATKREERRRRALRRSDSGRQGPGEAPFGARVMQACGADGSRIKPSRVMTARYDIRRPRACPVQVSGSPTIDGAIADEA